ncbi:MAG: TlpA family protein disulfide reductase [Bacteroidales bacterium]|nr:TlpA family protein disulfide reductase [Bacteroidales bacterium]
MKNILLGLLLIAGTTVWAQKTVPAIKIKDINGKTISSKQFGNDGKPYVLCFFATWCKPCLQEMNAFAEEYEDWNEESGFKLIAVSVDDSKSNARLKSLVNGNDWPFEVYSDANSNLKRAMNISSIPYALIIDEKRRVVYEKVSYTAGAEFELYKKFKKLINK